MTDKTLTSRLETLSHGDLVALRNSFPDNAPEQELIAPYEHRAWARERAQEEPTTAWATPILAAGYAGAKALGLAKGRTPASAKQIGQALLGTIEGYTTPAKKP